jgi:hypothetical protein
MRKLVETLMLGLILLSVLNASASEAENKEWALSIGAGASSDLLIRKQLSEDGALIFGVAFSTGESSLSSSKFKHSSIPVQVGYRNYFRGGNGVEQFMDGIVSYVHPSTTVDDPAVSSNDPVFVSLRLAYGVEKFLSDTFSIEASAGVYVGRLENSDAVDTSYSLPSVRLAVTSYF